MLRGNQHQPLPRNVTQVDRRLAGLLRILVENDHGAFAVAFPIQHRIEDVLTCNLCTERAVVNDIPQLILVTATQVIDLLTVLHHPRKLAKTALEVPGFVTKTVLVHQAHINAVLVEVIGEISHDRQFRIDIAHERRMVHRLTGVGSVVLPLNIVGTFARHDEIRIVFARQFQKFPGQQIIAAVNIAGDLVTMIRIVAEMSSGVMLVLVVVHAIGT